ncbi:MAG: 2-oxoisovalerate dehydrogenase [Chloroflexi bacterium]|nr:2-oxoisovalerate dehydrogenase [Chloroflexota bacterium]
MAKEVIFLVEEAPEGGYTAHALGEAIFTEGDSLEELREQVVDAVKCHFDEDEMPQMIRLHFVKEEVLAV